MAVGNGLDVMHGKIAFSQKYKVFGMMSCPGSVRHHFLGRYVIVVLMLSSVEKNYT